MHTMQTKKTSLLIPICLKIEKLNLNLFMASYLSRIRSVMQRHLICNFEIKLVSLKKL